MIAEDLFRNDLYLSLVWHPGLAAAKAAAIFADDLRTLFHQHDPAVSMWQWEDNKPTGQDGSDAVQPMATGQVSSYGEEPLAQEPAAFSHFDAVGNGSVQSPRWQLLDGRRQCMGYPTARPNVRSQP
ncbi:hypothetical protein [Rhizobium leguminosarum]|uniref:hypothetical protein n=1 Tax=Rhizobium TaxID=379 RepID=UPI00197D1866|nr:hypothetical protein [Rhizobium leguminosarum]